MALETPILITAFNRPDIVIQLTNKIKEVKPKKIYVFSDGWRNNNEKQLVLKSRNIIKDTVLQDCKVITKYEEYNLGSGYGVFKAIEWFFDNEEFGIILEEDCIPSIPFFNFCSELLIKYKNDLRIKIISGTNSFPDLCKDLKESYFFSNYASIWGWASWRDRWEGCDFFLEKFPAFLETKLKFNHFNKEENIVRFDMLKRGYKEINQFKTKYRNWDLQFGFHNWQNIGIGIVPKENLITNIGIGGVHGQGGSFFHLKPSSETFKIVSHPEFILRNQVYDSKYFNITRPKKGLISKFKRLIKRVLYL